MPTALHRQIGQLAVVGFAGTAIPPELRAVAREFDLGGVILFARNVESPEQVAGMVCEARQLAGSLPLWVGVDQEGGRVARLKRPFTEWPPMSAIGRADDETLTARFARALAVELLAVGMSIDFAPVLDVLTRPSNPAIGDRAIADRAGTVAAHGTVIVGALQEAGLAACGKHFPGHGDVGVDSHVDLPVVEHSPERLREVELVPFRAAIAAGVAGIMTGHLLVPAYDEERPATLSGVLVQRLLRDEMGFDGLVFTDDLDMKAVSARPAGGPAVVEAIGAGCDVALMCGADCGAHAVALEALVHAVERGELRSTRIDESMVRQRRAKERFATMPPQARATGRGRAMSSLNREWRPLPAGQLRALLGCEEHQAVAEEMRRHV